MWLIPTLQCCGSVLKRAWQVVRFIPCGRRTCQGMNQQSPPCVSRRLSWREPRPAWPCGRWGLSARGAWCRWEFPPGQTSAERGVSWVFGRQLPGVGAAASSIEQVLGKRAFWLIPVDWPSLFSVHFSSIICEYMSGVDWDEPKCRAKGCLGS